VVPTVASCSRECSTQNLHWIFDYKAHRLPSMLDFLADDEARLLAVGE
jgi:hypothetical protein